MGEGVVDPEVKSGIKERKGVHSPTHPHHHPHPPLTPLPKACSAWGVVSGRVYHDDIFPPSSNIYINASSKVRCLGII